MFRSLFLLMVAMLLSFSAHAWVVPSQKVSTSTTTRLFLHPDQASQLKSQAEAMFKHHGDTTDEEYEPFKTRSTPATNASVVRDSRKPRRVLPQVVRWCADRIAAGPKDGLKP